MANKSKENTDEPVVPVDEQQTEVEEVVTPTQTEVEEEVVETPTEGTAPEGVASASETVTEEPTGSEGTLEYQPVEGENVRHNPTGENKIEADLPTVEVKAEDMTEQNAPVTTDIEPTGPQGDMSEQTEEQEGQGNAEGQEEQEPEEQGSIQTLDANNIPDDPDEFAKQVQNTPEVQNIYDFIVNGEKELRESQKKERRDATMSAVGNLIRGIVNLVYTTKGSPNAYNHEQADKNTEAIHDHYDRVRKQLEENRKNRWQYYQQMRNQQLQERQQRHKEEVDAINAQIKQRELETQEKLNALDAQLKEEKIGEARYKKEHARIIAENDEETQRLNNLKKQADIDLRQSQADKNRASAASMTKKTDAQMRKTDTETDILEGTTGNTGKVLNLTPLF